MHGNRLKMELKIYVTGSGKSCYLRTRINIYKSLSTVVLNRMDQPKNIWLPKRMHLDKQ